MKPKGGDLLATTELASKQPALLREVRILADYFHSHVLDSPEIGIPFIERARQLGVRNICIHKGLLFPGSPPMSAVPQRSTQT